MKNKEGYSKALELLHKASSASGFMASPDELDNYRRVWTRDGVVTGLAALLTKEPDLINTFYTTLKTIFQYQHPLGFMPSNVTAEGKVSYGGTAGRADNPSWAVIGLCHYTISTGDHSLAVQFKTETEKCFHILDIWEYNAKHLVYVPQSGDWADEYLYHGYILFDQLLRIWALRLASRVYNRYEWHEKAKDIEEVIRINYWNGDNKTGLYSSNLVHQRLSAPTEYWFMGFNPSRIYSQFDLQANALAILLDLGNEQQNESVFQFINRKWITGSSIIPSFYPPVIPGNWQMHDLENNYAFRFRNKAHEFHNGGLWPVWNGFMAAALRKAGMHPGAESLTHQIHISNERNAWNFNECFHGESGQPIGVPYCTWSAAGAIIAENALNDNHLITK